MLKKEENLNLFEFCHYVVEIPTVELDVYNLTNTVNYYKSKKYLECTIGNEGLIISGSGKAWYDIFEKERFEAQNESICFVLRNINPFLFNFPCNKKIAINVLSKVEVQKKEKDIESVNKIKLQSDRALHDWITVKFENISLGFIDEIKNNKEFSFAHTSTRLGLYRELFAVVDGIMMNNNVDKGKVEECIIKIQDTYNYLINRGHKKDYVRQLLPIATAGSIFAAGRLSCWKELFDSQTKENSHWEIKLLLNDLKKELEEIRYNF